MAVQPGSTIDHGYTAHFSATLDVSGFFTGTGLSSSLQEMSATGMPL
jgi:hypothetical protein